MRLGFDHKKLNNWSSNTCHQWVNIHPYTHIQYIYVPSFLPPPFPHTQHIQHKQQPTFGCVTHDVFFFFFLLLLNSTKNRVINFACFFILIFILFICVYVSVSRVYEYVNVLVLDVKGESICEDICECVWMYVNPLMACVAWSVI